MSKVFQKFGQNFDPSKPSKSKDTAVLSWGNFQTKKLLKMFQKFGQNFDPSKPSKSKDTAVLSWGIFQEKKKCRKFFKNLVKTLFPSKPSINQKIQPF